MIWSFESFSKSSFVYRVYSTHSLLSSHLFLDKFITHSHCQEAQKDIHRIHPPWGAMPWIPGDGSIVWMEFGSHKVGHQAASSCCGSSPVWYSPSRGHGTTNSLARAQIQLKQNTFHSKKETSLIQIFGQCLVCTVLGGKKKKLSTPSVQVNQKNTHTHTPGGQECHLPIPRGSFRTTVGRALVLLRMSHHQKPRNELQLH